MRARSIGGLALVTGASSGIGAATARALAVSGAKVVLWARNIDRLRQEAQLIREAGGIADISVVDMSQKEQIKTAVSSFLKKYGAPEILVNNAGSGVWRSVQESNPDLVESAMSVPYFAAFHTTREFLPAMRKTGGWIVNITSPASFVAWPEAAAYVAARWAMLGFHKALRVELLGTRVRPLLAVFGKVSSNYWINNPGSEERLPRIARWFKTLTPEEAAQTILRGMARDRGLVVAPAMVRVLLLAARLMPNSVERLLCNGHGAVV